jgi:hypothetical protein
MGYFRVYFFVVAVFIAVTNAEKVSYKNYKIYTLTSSTDQHKAVFLKLITTNSNVSTFLY